MRCRAWLAVAILVASSGSAFACLWDYDTLAIELKRFPSTLELITGKFLRHSEAFYRWRVADRLARLQDSPGDFRLTDDLCVAYDKLGEHEKAIELMETQLAASPKRYESHANLGTFLIHNGQLKEGIKHIENAIELNADAHFGREIYQVQLVRYLLAKGHEEGEQLSLPLDQNSDVFQPIGFAKFLAEQIPEPKSGDAREQFDSEAAVKGVAGMIRFGKHDSPVLLEALGDLLLVGTTDDGKRLATRAYLKAALEVEGEARDKYRMKAEKALSMQVSGRGSTTEITLGSVESRLEKEIALSEQWVAAVFADEAAWIGLGGDVDAAYTKKYYEEPRVYSAKISPHEPRSPWQIAILASLALIAVLAIVILLRKRGSCPPAKIVGPTD